MTDPSHEDLDRASDAGLDLPPMFYVTFGRNDGISEWWDLYFVEAEEAYRWARHELHLRRHRVGQWVARIDEVHWDRDEGTFCGTDEPIATVEMS